MHKIVELMHRYCYDYTNCQNFGACNKVMVPGYTLYMGAYTLAGRDEQYKPATQKQFDQFPGLCLTVNNIVTNGDRLLMHFSEHGASVSHGGARAAWSGIALYRWDGDRLTECSVEQDYYSRRQQLHSGQCNPVESPAVSPWDTQPEPACLEIEETVRSLLESDDIMTKDNVVCDDAWVGSPYRCVLVPNSTTIDDLFSAGNTVAFRITQIGRVTDEFGAGNPGIKACEGRLYAIGYVTLQNNQVVSGRIIRNRLSLRRLLSQGS